LAEISIFDQHFGFCPTFRFLINISTFGQNSDFDQISAFAQNFDLYKNVFDNIITFSFFTKTSYLTKISNFGQQISRQTLFNSAQALRI